MNEPEKCIIAKGWQLVMLKAAVFLQF